MAGTTPNGIPYPTGTDRVMDGDNAMQAIAEKVDPSIAAFSSVGALGAGITGKCNVFRRGRIILVELDLSAVATLYVGNTAATLPGGYRPPEVWHFALSLVAVPAATVPFEVNTSGGIVPNVVGVVAPGRVIGSVVFPLPPTQA